MATRPALTLANPAQWSGIGGNSLSGFNNGSLALPSQQITYLTFFIQADLKSNNTARLLLNFSGVTPTPGNAPVVLTDGQVLTISMQTSNPINWALVDGSNNPVTAGANDYIRAMAFL